MPTYSYTHGSTSALNRLRFLLGDHRGTDSTTYLFSDEELTDCLLLAGTTAGSTLTPGIVTACRIALQCRINRESMSAGVAGTTDTTDRPQSLINAERALGSVDYPGSAPILLGNPDPIPGLNGDDTP